ncbi:glycoside hydrolase family 2 protein [Subtercola sp. RTI3]|uniref:glycoside hydrolase family 2 protein n=1 Tax=Subtercola sp. RTI3 TaxID=3048639 RepID=UPI002B22A2A6|nr:sugar-binding domain-containing protein [Subtercola sp. RTI3]MEA9985615.1 glycoside hydrolase family 2 TIM barrel-domain containing protein [Subtercola sp. RTI3]
MTTISPAIGLADGPTDTVPRGEYPRPQFDRAHSWRSLNGEWEFARGTGHVFDATIVVPFAWETPASGIEAHWLERAVYRRRFAVPSEWQDERVVLHFGAVHHEASVSVDGVLVGTHVGGSTHFEIDITNALSGDIDHEVRVEVYAPVDKRNIVHGKQRSMPRDDYDSCAFTPSSGIWQPVWLECRPETFLDALVLTPTADLTGLQVTGRVRGEHSATAVVEISIDSVDTDTASTPVSISAAALEEGYVITVTQPRLWSPSDPYLYRVRVDVASDSGVDRVVSNAGLRRIETRGNGIYLNGRRISLRGVLDQGYWPETGMTAPTDAAFVRDLEIARDAGFTMVRKHLKLEDPRFYHHADLAGMLVWAEPASTGRFSAAAARSFAAQIRPMAESLGSHPSIVVWGLYNEEWGLDWDLPNDPEKQAVVRAAFDELSGLDSSRPIVDNSGWTHLETDLVDWHMYDEHPSGWARKVRELVESDDPTFPVAVAVDVTVDKALMIGRSVPRDVPFLNSEFGGGWTSLDRGWNLHWQTQELRRHDSIAGWVWTELNDIEHESAGIVDASRTLKDDGGRPARYANAETTPVFDIVPVAPGRDIVAPDGRVTFGVAVSHHGADDLDVDVFIAWGPVFGLEAESTELRSGRVVAQPFILSDAVTIETALPDPGNARRLHVILRSEGAEVGRGLIDVVR